MLSLFKSGEYNLKFRMIRFYGVYWSAGGLAWNKPKLTRLPERAKSE
jgi:hypothetical protein